MKNLLRSMVCSIALVTSTAYAGEVGTATKEDVTLAAEAADFFQYASGVNPQGNEGSSGFDAAFDAYGDGEWQKIAKVNGDGPVTYEASDFLGKISFTFTLVDGKSGFWSMTNNDALNDLTLDLVFAMHVGGGSGAWLFDDQFIASGQTLQGTWVQNMVNGNQQQVTDFSNLTFFGRDLVPSIPIIEVPEPASLATLALGFGLMGLARRRKQK